MIRNKEIRVRVSKEEKQMIKSFISRGKEDGLWKTHRQMLQTLIDYWEQNHIQGKFIKKD